MTLSVHAERIAARYAKCIEMSKRARWDIDDDGAGLGADTIARRR